MLVLYRLHCKKSTRHSEKNTLQFTVSLSLFPQALCSGRPFNLYNPLSKYYQYIFGDGLLDLMIYFFVERVFQSHENFVQLFRSHYKQPTFARFIFSFSHCKYLVLNKIYQQHITHSALRKGYCIHSLD